MPAEAFKHLLSPGRIGPLELRNRIIVTAMGVNLAEPDGTCGQRIRAFHEEQARGGVGLVNIGVAGVAWPIGGDDAVERTQESRRVIARGGQGRLIVQADVPPPIRGEAAHQRGLAALARAVDHHHGSTRKRDCHLPGGMARNEGIVGWWHGVSRRFGRRPIRIVCPSNPDYKAVHSGSSRIRLGLVAIITEQQIFEPTGATVPERLRPEPGDTR